MPKYHSMHFAVSTFTVRALPSPCSIPANTLAAAGRVVLTFAWSRLDDDGCGSDW